MSRQKVRNTVFLAVSAALAVVLMLTVRFPLFAAAPFLEYDMGDIPVLIATVLAGVPGGLAVLATVSVIQALTVSASSGFVGCIMHLLASGAYVIAAGLIYKTKKNVPSLIAGLCVGAVLMTLVMIPCNLVLTTYFLGTPVEAVKQMLLPVIIPFNLIKGVINAAVTLALYKPLSIVYTKLKKEA